MKAQQMLATTNEEFHSPIILLPLPLTSWKINFAKRVMSSKVSRQLGPNYEKPQHFLYAVTATVKGQSCELTVQLSGFILVVNIVAINSSFHLQILF